MDPEENKDQANEPEAVFNDRITITTLEELEERDREYTRNLTPLQRLEYLNKLISITYGQDLSVQEREFYEGKIIIKKQE